jgi:toxin ParE1/3/4
MPLPIRKSLQAVADLAGIADYLWQEAGERTSDRFLQAAEKAITDLAAMPGLGAAWGSALTRLADIRTWGVPGFRKWIIFYRESAQGLEVLRVLHGARDLTDKDITEIV